MGRQESSPGTRRPRAGRRHAGYGGAGREGRGDEGNLPARSGDRTLPAGHSGSRPSGARVPRSPGAAGSSERVNRASHLPGTG